MLSFTPEMKGAIKSHKYSCIDNSPFSNYVMHPFWNYIIQFFPKWIAPNLLTIVGFSITVLNFLIISIFNPDFETAHSLPLNCWLVTAIMVFIAHTLDGIDGKQARRLNMSSPLGELLDHCCDAWTAFFLPVTILSMFNGIMHINDMFFAVWIISSTFLGAHWEKSVTGILYLPWSYDIGQISAVLMCLLTYFFSPSIWQFNLFLINRPFVDIVLIVGYVAFWLIYVPKILICMTIECKQNKRPFPSFFVFLRPILGNVIIFLTSWLWLTYSPSRIYELTPRIFLCCCCTLASHLTTCLIIADVTKSPPPIMPKISIIYCISCVSICFLLPQQLSLHLELPLLYTLTFLVVSFHIAFGNNVINEMCSILKIRAWTI